MNTEESVLCTTHQGEVSTTAPFAEVMVLLTKHQHIELVSQVNSYKSLHERALARELDLKKQLEHEKSKVRDFDQRLYGKKSEQSKKTEANTGGHCSTTLRSKGQQEGSLGHGRTRRPDLPVVIEIRDLDEGKKAAVNAA